ncbi:MAG: hypothetical protein Q8N23_01075 [Archangium sp.]|nr:hypothetical protein [Archangium sp.]MDP3570131.1 hypothetical protein [Archangium sp.]
MSTAGLACSGPGALDAMRLADRIGWACFLVSVVVTGAAIIKGLPFRSSLAWVAALVGVVVLLGHPAVWVSAYIGDCGSTRQTLAPIATVLHALAVGFVISRKP